jgi:hypothetical protein
MVSATVFGQVPGPFPKFRDGVEQPPKEVRTNAPFDVPKLFEAPPPEQNAERLYLDALHEFSAELYVVYPVGPDPISPRSEVASGRSKRFLDVYQAWMNDPKSVTDVAIDAVVDEHREGFRKLALAQMRDRCVFQTGVAFTALLPHAQAARQVARVTSLKVHRALDRGNVDAAIADVKMILRLAYDLRPRGFMISQLVSGAILNVVGKEMVNPILAAPGLTPEQCARLAAVLTEHDAAVQVLDPYSVSLEMEYISTRVSLLDLIRHQDKLFRSMGLRPGASVAKSLIAPSPEPTSKAAPNTNPGPASEGDDSDAIPDDVDEQLARIADAELTRLITRLNSYYGALLELKDLPCAARLSKLPSVSEFLGGSDVLSRVVRAFLPSAGHYVAAIGRTEATLRAFECLSAVRHWQLTHQGAAPDNLAAACQGVGMKLIPADPFDGRPMHLVTVRGELVVYSVGKDNRDDGGLVDSNNDSVPGDLTYRLQGPRGK